MNISGVELIRILISKRKKEDIKWLLLCLNMQKKWRGLIFFFINFDFCEY